MTNEKLTNIEIAMYALYLCGAINKKIHTEHVSQKCFDLTPDRFSWHLYSYPDKETVRKALYDAMRDERKLVDGRSGIEAKGKELDGWALTRAGIKWIKDNEKRMKKLLKGPKKESNRHERELFERRITDSPAYNRYRLEQSTENLKDFEFTDLLRCSPDAPTEVMQKKYDAIINKAEELDCLDVVEFLERCASKFKALLYR